MGKDPPGEPKINKENNSTEWHLDHRPWDRGASHGALEPRKGDPGDTSRPSGPLPRAGRALWEALRARSVPEAAKQQPTKSRRPRRWRNGPGLPGTAVGGLEIQRQSGPHTRAGTRTIRALGNDSKAEEKLTEATTQRAGAGGPQERGHALGMGGKKPTVSITRENNDNAAVPTASQVSYLYGSERAQGRTRGGNKTALKTDVCSCLVNKAGGRAGTVRVTRVPLPWGLLGALPSISEHREAALGPGSSPKGWGRQDISLCAHQPQLATNSRIQGSGSASVSPCSSASGPTNE